MIMERLSFVIEILFVSFIFLFLCRFYEIYLVILNGRRLNEKRQEVELKCQGTKGR